MRALLACTRADIALYSHTVRQSYLGPGSIPGTDLVRCFFLFCFFFEFFCPPPPPAHHQSNGGERLCLEVQPKQSI